MLLKKEIFRKAQVGLCDLCSRPLVDSLVKQGKRTNENKMNPLKLGGNMKSGFNYFITSIFNKNVIPCNLEFLLFLINSVVFVVFFIFFFFSERNQTFSPTKFYTCKICSNENLYHKLVTFCFI